MAQSCLCATTNGLNTNDNQAESIDREAHDIAGWRCLVFQPLGLLLKLWGRTLRIECTEESRRSATFRDEPVAIVLWHNRLFLASEFFRRYRRPRPTYALVSASRDGAWLAAFFAVFGLRSVRGSSSRGGREAAGALIATLRAGNDIGITPDGPLGPMYDFKEGAFIMARRAGAPVLLLGWRFESAWRLKSWDGFYIPKPFSRVHLTCRLISAAEVRAKEATAQLFRDRLMAINPD